MHTFLVFAVFIAISVAAPQYKSQSNLSDPKGATILEQEYKNEGAGTYNFAYQTSDGMSREEKAELKNVGSENEALVVEGSFSYIGTDGVTYTISYVADENGYRPSGDHVPRV